jgi:hypothetical protein
VRGTLIHLTGRTAVLHSTYRDLFAQSGECVLIFFKIRRIGALRTAETSRKKFRERSFSK